MIAYTARESHQTLTKMSDWSNILNSSPQRGVRFFQQH